MKRYPIIHEMRACDAAKTVCQIRFDNGNLVLSVHVIIFQSAGEGSTIHVISIDISMVRVHQLFVHPPSGILLPFFTSAFNCVVIGWSFVVASQDILIAQNAGPEAELKQSKMSYSTWTRFHYFPLSYPFYCYHLF